MTYLRRCMMSNKENPFFLKWPQDPKEDIFDSPDIASVSKFQEPEEWDELYPRVEWGRILRYIFWAYDAGSPLLKLSSRKETRQEAMAKAGLKSSPDVLNAIESPHTRNAIRFFFSYQNNYDLNWHITAKEYFENLMDLIRESVSGTDLGDDKIANAYKTKMQLLKDSETLRENLNNWALSMRQRTNGVSDYVAAELSPESPEKFIPKRNKYDE